MQKDITELQPEQWPEQWDITALDADPVRGAVWTTPSLAGFQVRPAPEACDKAMGADGKPLMGAGEAFYLSFTLGVRLETGRACLLLRGATLGACRLGLAIPAGARPRHSLLFAARSLGRAMGLCLEEGAVCRPARQQGERTFATPGRPPQCAPPACGYPATLPLFGDHTC